ncbi:hypothetical protein IV203_009874 [Nitzschia inconspicua]|uniref:Uncharacterized protein n=1 Tax=Nitzschia inconspicua TaxID=303405 RepID=A0A9K3KW94_9STRA|nr:hypothetical protein IV203_009874 [Nitzschia inconspicua]
MIRSIIPARTTFRRIFFQPLVLFLFATAFPGRLVVVSASFASSSSAAVIKELEHYWSDPSDIIANIQDYELLWIQPSGCVWSECAIDDTDDAYMGDNRDGDERWYLYRTQSFCANAAFSLYGIRKDENKRVRDWRGCNRKNFINSYFTYGGADILLRAIGQEPDVYYNTSYTYQQRRMEDNYNYNYYGNYNDDAAAAAANDDGATVSREYTNADCVEVDGSDIKHKSGNNNGQQGQDYTYMSTMGCSSTPQEGDAAKFVMARFEAETCDGNYYLDTLDTMESYNAQYENIGKCHRIWDARWSSTSSSNNNNNNNDDDDIVFLMRNSWTCDVALYPDGCPDPYGQKAKFLRALQIAARGGNAKLSMRNMNAKRPLRITSALLLALGSVLFGIGYYMKNWKRVAAHTTARTLQTTPSRFQLVVHFTRAYLTCLWEDMTYTLNNWWLIIGFFITKMCHQNGGNRRTSSENERAEALMKDEEETSKQLS